MPRSNKPRQPWATLAKLTDPDALDAALDGVERAVRVVDVIHGQARNSVGLLRAVRDDPEVRSAATRAAGRFVVDGLVNLGVRRGFL